MKTTTDGLIEPHGGEVIDRVVGEKERSALEQRLASMPKIALPEQQQCDLEMIAVGAFSPLKGFMGADDFHAVCDRMQLANGLPWGIPITFCVDRQTADTLETGQQICLADEQDRPLAVMTVEEKYQHDKAKEAEKIYLTDDVKHPGVAVLQSRGRDPRRQENAADSLCRGISETG